MSTIRERAKGWKLDVAQAWGLKVTDFRVLRRLRVRPAFSVVVRRVPNPSFDVVAWMRRYIAGVIAEVKREHGEVSDA